MGCNFALAGGSVIGRDHRLVPKNNQDSWSIWQSDKLTIAVVADGCGSGAHSEVGAKIGVSLISRLLRSEYQADGRIHWSRVQLQAVSQLDVLARAMGENYRTVVEQYLLFTLVGVVINEQSTQFFALGDGCVIVNGDSIPLGPFPGNMPPYLGYNLLPGELAIDERSLRLTPLLTLPTQDLGTFLIGTDGVDDLVRSSETNMPGMAKPVGAIDQFWQNDRYFRGNPELVTRQLKLIGRDWPLHDPQPGLLHDDTTLIAGRRIVTANMLETEES